MQKCRGVRRKMQFLQEHYFLEGKSWSCELRCTLYKGGVHFGRMHARQRKLKAKDKYMYALKRALFEEKQKNYTQENYSQRRAAAAG